VRRLTSRIGPIGALVDVEIGVAKPNRHALVRAGQALPPSIVLTLLVDTGASHTFVDASRLASLGISPIDSCQYHSSSTQGVAAECDVYPVSLALGTLADQNLWRFDPFKIMATALREHGHHGLLGRDILDLVQLDWNGPTGSLVILYP